MNFRAASLLLVAGLAVSCAPAADEEAAAEPAAEMSADETARARLLNEARTASSLNHPHICTIFEVGEAEGRAYIALEHVEGKPLAAMVPEGGLPTDAVLRYGTQIADALAHAHDRGVIHRDLKTSNVMITPEGRAKVLDFGLAKKLRDEDLAEVTRSGKALTQAGVTSGSTPGVKPRFPASSMRSTQKLHLVATDMRCSSKRFSSDSVRFAP